MIFMVGINQGFEAAVAAGAKEIAVFASASESFSKNNINCTIEESLARYRDVIQASRKLSIPVRGYATMHFASFVLDCTLGVLLSSLIIYY